MNRLIVKAGAALGALVLLLVLTVAFIPDSAIRSLVSRGLENQGYTCTAVRLGKAFPLGVSARSLVIATGQGPVLKADRAVIRLRLLPLLLGRVQVGVNVQIGGGTITGSCTVTQGGRVNLTANRIRLEDIPFFATVAGAQAKGDLRGSVSLTGLRRTPAGDLQLEVRGAEFAGLKLGGTPLPDATYSAVQGKLTARGGRVSIDSLTFQGEGLYARLKGDLPATAPLSAAPLNITLELMPKPEFLDKQKFVFLLLIKYQDTPGHYQIPVRGTLGHPAVF